MQPGLGIDSSEPEGFEAKASDSSRTYRRKNESKDKTIRLRKYLIDGSVGKDSGATVSAVPNAELYPLAV